MQAISSYVLIFSEICGDFLDMIFRLILDSVVATEGNGQLGLCILDEFLGCVLLARALERGPGVMLLVRLDVPQARALFIVVTELGLLAQAIQSKALRNG